MRKFRKMLVTMATILSGTVMSSLWLTHNDNWKITLPIALFCLTLERYMEE